MFWFEKVRREGMADLEGSIAAFGQATWFGLRGAARRRSRCMADAEDALQEGCLRLIEDERRLGAVRPVAYLARVVRNLAIDQRRRRRIEARLFAAIECCEQAPADSRSPETLAAERQALARIAAALQQLPERTRRAFELHRLDGLGQRAIADRLGISPSLAHRLVKDALTHCREAVDRGIGDRR